MDRQKRVARGYQEVDMNRHETAPTHSVYWIHEVLYRKEFERVGGVFEYMDPGRSTIGGYCACGLPRGSPRPGGAGDAGA